MKPLSLANRVALLVGLTAVILLGAAALVMDRLVDAEMQRRFDASLLLQAHALASLVEQGTDGLEMEAGGHRVDHPLVTSSTQTFIARCPGEKPLTQGVQADLALPGMQPMSTGQQALFSTSGTGNVLRRTVQIQFDLYGEDEIAAGAQRTTCQFLLMQPSAPLDDILLETDAILVAVPMTALVAILLLSPWLVRRGLQPLKVLREEMRDIGPQQPGQRLPDSRIGEIEPLVQRFNEVLERMDQGVLRERRFAGAVAHETRTHLAELRTLLDVELRHPSQRPVADVLGDISDISSELESTVSGLLMLTRIEAGIESLQEALVNPVQMIEAQIDHHRPAIMARHLVMDIDTRDTSIKLDTDRDLLKLVIANLMANATGHAPIESRIAVMVTSNQLQVRNPAPELDATDIHYLGQRHWQKSRESDKHAGLGLSLAGAAARALGMSLGFELDDAHMLTATLDWSESVHEADAESTRQQADGQ